MCHDGDDKGAAAALASRRSHELIDFEHDRFAEPTSKRFVRN